MAGEYDRSFNLTTSYRRDSDIPRPFGTKDKAILDARFRKVAVSNNYSSSSELVYHYEEVQTGQENINELMSRKDSTMTNYITWLVSNCGDTRGAQVRLEYVKK